MQTQVFTGQILSKPKFLPVETQVFTGQPNIITKSLCFDFVFIFLEKSKKWKKRKKPRS
jgi:hypothetical protein